MWLETQSHPLVKAIRTKMADDGDFPKVFPPTTDAPTDVLSHEAGEGGMTCPRSLIVLPYCEGARGSKFSVLLVGYRKVIPENRPTLWIPTPLAELSCIAGDLPGPSANDMTGRMLLPGENLCDHIQLTNGGVGATGEIISFGAGSGRAAFALIELRGCQRFRLYFAGSQLAMNAYIARV